MKLKNLIKEAKSKKNSEEQKTMMNVGGDKMLKIAQSLVNSGYDLEDIMNFLKKHLKF